MVEYAGTEAEPLTDGEARAEKARIRRESKDAAAAMGPEARAAAGKRIAEQVLSLPSWKRAQTVMAFAAMPLEPDTAPLLEAALSEGKTLLLPRCEDGARMRALPVRDLKSLAPGWMGIPEPPEAEEGPEPDLILVPCVAAARDGRRLGHGAGYYDRYLEGRGAETVCLCFRSCLRDDLPACGHDVRMDRVITD